MIVTDEMLYEAKNKAWKYKKNKNSDEQIFFITDVYSDDIDSVLCSINEITAGEGCMEVISSSGWCLWGECEYFTEVSDSAVDRYIKQGVKGVRGAFFDYIDVDENVHNHYVGKVLKEETESMVCYYFLKEKAYKCDALFVSKEFDKISYETNTQYVRHSIDVRRRFELVTKEEYKAKLSEYFEKVLDEL